VADTEEPSRSPSIAAALERSHATPVAHPHRLGLFLFAAALAVCLPGYLVAVVPGGWFPGASTMTWSATQLSFSRGFGVVENDFLVVYQRCGVQYDPGTERLRQDGGTPISAELVVSEPGAALAFRAFALRCARADAGGEPQSA
jgi:hypothetical protein